MTPLPQVRHWGMREYQACADAMQHHVETRTGESTDEIWMLQHPQVLTLGVGADPQHIQPHNSLPVIRSRRGGQVTCHAPGQLVVYLMLDLRRLHIGVRALVRHVENAVLALLAEAGLAGHRDSHMPGAYINGEKIASIGLHVSRGYSSHGLALNVAPDLTLFRHINICGKPGLQATSLREHGVLWNVQETAAKLLPLLVKELYSRPASS